VGLVSSLAKGFFSFILDAVSGILIFIGTFLLLFGDVGFGIMIFIGGCSFLALSESVSIIQAKFSKDVTESTGEKGITDLLIFALGSLAFPVFFLFLYVSAIRSWLILVLALTSLPVAVIKTVSKWVKMKMNNAKVKITRQKKR
jgi:hypothetical protein